MEQIKLPIKTNNGLEEIAALGRRLEELQASLAEKEAEVKDLKQQIAIIETEHLPDILTEMGIAEVTLLNGRSIKLETFPTGRLSAETHGPALQWLREQNLDGIIKNDITVNFGKSEDDRAAWLRELLDGQDMTYKVKEDIHPSTLKAFIKEQCEINPDFPKKLFNVFEVRKVNFK